MLSQSQFLLSSAMTSYRALTVWQDQAAPACYRLLTAGISSSAYLTWQVLRYLLQYLDTSQARPHREGGTILSNLGKLSPSSIGQWLSAQSPAVGAWTPHPCPRRQSEKSSQVCLVINHCANSAEIRNEPLTTNFLYPATAKHYEHLSPSVLAPPPTAHHDLSCIPQRTAS